MNGWTLDILRQGAVDWWLVVCAVMLALMLVRAIRDRMWASREGWGYLFAWAGGLAGVIAIPALGLSAWWGIIWTGYCASLSTIVLYRPMVRQLGRLRGGVLLGLRLAVLGLLILMLFEPVLRYTTTRQPDRALYLLVDTSGSMSVPDIQNGPTRIQSAWEAIRGQLPELRRHFDVKLRTFDSDVKELDRPEDLEKVRAQGQATDIAKAIDHVANEQGPKDSQIVLLSDGHDNANVDVVKRIVSAGRVVHTVTAGSEQTQSAAVQNVAVESVDVDGDSGDLAVGHEGKLKVHITSTALANRVVDVKWARVNADGSTSGAVDSQKLVLEPRPEGQTIAIPYKPAAAGLQRVAVWIDPIPGERTTVDNRQEFQGLAMDPQIKVLYVEGRARPEYRELKRALDRDSNIEAATLLRLQAEKFAAAGTVDGEKITGLPRTAEGWRKFDVIILGDLDATFLSKAQQAAIEQAVSDGSGLVMIGGQSSFGPGGYGATPIEKALPVLLGGTDAAQEKSVFVPRLTQQGAAHPAMEGLSEWFGVGAEAGQRSLPQLKGNVVVQKPKTGAMVLLVHEGEKGPDGRPEIILATQQYGKGRSAAFTADTTYLWYLPLRGMGQESPYNRFWGQLVRWLAGADVKNRQQGAGVEAMLTRSVYQPGEKVEVRAMVRDERGDATRYAEVQVEFHKQGEAAADLKRSNLNPAESRTGLYEAKVSGIGAGDWVIKVIAKKDGKELGTKELKLTVMSPAEELVDLAAKPQVMADIAQKTRGWAYALPQFADLVRQLATADTGAQPVKQVVVPLSNLARVLPAVLGRPVHWASKYDLPMQASVVVSLLLAEWILRRRWQMS